MGLWMPNAKLTIAQNGRLWREVPPLYPSLPVICQINTGRETVRERVNTGKSDLSPCRLGLRFLAPSATVMWAECHHFFGGAHTVHPLFSWVWDSQTPSCKSWGISREQAGLQPGEETPVHTWQQRLVLCLLRICRYSRNIYIIQAQTQTRTNKARQRDKEKHKKMFRQGQLCLHNASHQP